MKISKLLLLLPICLLFIGLSSCKKDQQTDAVLETTIDGQKSTSLDTKAELEEYTQLMAVHNARLAAMGAQDRNCQKVVRVPADFPTIQEAIDAVCAGGKVFVSDGEYNETVTVYKPGLNIKANGDVLLFGQFLLTAAANDVTIQQFNIFPPAGGNGIFVAGASGGEIKLNTITGGFTGINLRNASDVSVTHNTVSDGGWGIAFVSSPAYPGAISCNDNLIAHNTVTGTTVASPIHLQGNCDHNTVHDNTVTLKTNVNPNLQVNAGITLYSAVNGFCDNNTVRNNYVVNNACVGIWLINGGTNNDIGPDNTFNSNGTYGIWLPGGTLDNHVFDNTALDNPTCDIVNQGIGNTFVNNTAGCTIGL